MSDVAATWAIAYQFLEVLWAGRVVVIDDDRLEALFRESGPGVAHGGPEGLLALVDALAPRAAPAGGPVRTHVAAAAASISELGDLRRGARFFARDELAAKLHELPWEVAVLRWPTAVLAEPGRRIEVLRALEAGVELGRTVALWLEAGAGDEGPIDVAATSELVQTRLPGARIFGVYTPGVAVVVPFSDRTGEDAEVGTVYDGTLASTAPGFRAFVAIAGRSRDLGDDAMLVELPAAAELADEHAGPHQARHELQMARRQADVDAIERQRLVERLDRAEAEKAALEDELEDAQEHLARALGGAASDDDPADAAVAVAPAPAAIRERLDAALAEQQRLRWEVARLEAELAVAARRPVEELEAEVASLRARLAGDAGGEGGARGDRRPRETAVEGEDDPGRSPLRRRVDRALARLMQRLERSDLRALELRRELEGLRRILRR